MSTTFQKCPKCEGTGKKNNPIVTGNAYFDILFNAQSIYMDKDGKIKNVADIPCPVCNGKMIISTETGKPPID